MNDGLSRARMARAPLFPALVAGLSCSSVLLSGRKLLNLVPESEVLSASFQHYQPVR